MTQGERSDSFNRLRQELKRLQEQVEEFQEIAADIMEGWVSNFLGHLPHDIKNGIEVECKKNLF